MKKLFCIVAAIIILSTANAQETHFGVKAGVNIASVEVEDGDDLNSKVGLHIGGLAHIHISQHFALQPELVFFNAGRQSGRQ